MSKYKKIELSSLFSHNFKFEVHNCLNPYFEELYYKYLDKGIRLVYRGEDLLKYINKNKKILLDDSKFDISKYIKKERLKTVLKGAYGSLVFLSLLYGHVSYKDYKIHEEANARNAYAVLKDISDDSNNDNINEVNTKLLK